METIARTQTIVRLRNDVLARAKYKSKQQGISFNAFVENLIVEATKPVIPKLPKDFKIDSEIEALSGMIPAPTKEQLEADDRLAYIIGKGM